MAETVAATVLLRVPRVLLCTHGDGQLWDTVEVQQQGKKKSEQPG